MKKIIAPLLLAVLSMPSHAQVNPELKKAILQSFEYFPRIQELQKGVETNSLRVGLAQSNYYPVVSGIASYNYVSPVSQFFLNGAERQFQPNNNFNFNIGVTQPIWDFNKTNSQIAKAKTELQSAGTLVEQAKGQVAAQVATVYYSMVYLTRAIAVEDSLLNFLHENKTIVETRIRRGDALQIDLTNIQSNIDLEENRKVDFINQWQKQKALLTYATGASLSPTASDFSFPVSTNDLKNNFDLRLANERIQSSAYDLAYSQNSRYPVISFVGGAGYRNGYLPDLNGIVFNYAVGLNVSVPIYSAGKTSQNIRIATRTWEANQLAAKQTENTLNKDLAQVQADITSNEDRIRHTESQVAYAREALALTQTRYRQGVATHLDLLNSSSNLQRVLLNQLQYQYQLCTARIELARLTGWAYWTDK